MAPKKGEAAEGDTTTALGGAEPDVSYSGKQLGESETLGLDNFELPKSQVVKLAKSVTPSNVQLRKDVYAALIKSSTVFINYLSAAAQDNAASDNRKTMSGSDVLAAVKDIDMPPEMHSVLVKHLNAYRRAQQQKKTTAKKAAVTEKASSAKKVDGEEDDASAKQQDMDAEEQDGEAGGDAEDEEENEDEQADGGDVMDEDEPDDPPS